MIHWSFTIMSKFLGISLMLGLVSSTVCLFLAMLCLSAVNNENDCGRKMVPLINE